jgi:hypothetical protein
MPKPLPKTTSGGCAVAEIKSLLLLLSELLSSVVFWGLLWSSLLLLVLLMLLSLIGSLEILWCSLLPSLSMYGVNTSCQRKYSKWLKPNQNCVSI